MKSNSKRAVIPSTSLGAPAPTSSSAAPKRAAKAKVASQSKPASRPPSKQDRVLAILRQKEGTTIAAVMKATGWQAHSVRGFFAGVVRKKLRLNLVSQDANGKRTYRIAAGNRVGPSRSKRKLAK